jgi:hypothetical protein
MLKLEELRKDVLVAGIMPGQNVRIISVDMIGVNALTVVYETADGALAKRTLFRDQEAHLVIATKDAASWTFDANGDDFKLVTESVNYDLKDLLARAARPDASR